MKFSIGDKVLVKRTDDEGVVVAIVSDTLLEVDVNGTIFPVHIDEIDHPYLKWFTEKSKQKKKPAAPPEQLPVERIKQRPQRLAQGIYLSFMPIFQLQGLDDVVQELKIYLINEQPLDITYAYELRLPQETVFAHKGSLHAFGNVYLHTISFEDAGKQPRFHWSIAAKGMQPATDVLRLKPAKLFEHINHLLEENTPSFNIQLVETLLPPAEGLPLPEQVKASIAPMQKKAVHHGNKPRYKDAPQYELDLHIDKLVSDTRGMSNGDIMEIQLNALRHYLQLAIANRQEQMAVIHGLGLGTLREAVHAVLKKTPHVKRYMNEWHGKYGFGATMVYFKYF